MKQQKPAVWKPTRRYKIGMMWDHAQSVHEVCEQVDRLFTRNILLFELGALSDAELDEAVEVVEPFFQIGENLERMDLDPEERAAAEKCTREMLERIRARQE